MWFPGGTRADVDDVGLTGMPPVLYGQKIQRIIPVWAAALAQQRLALCHRPVPPVVDLPNIYSHRARRRQSFWWIELEILG
jgi:hypothetical protein